MPFEQEKELQPSEVTEVDLTIGDGETLLILKRLADGSIVVPLFSHHAKSSAPLSDRALADLIRALCRDAIRGLADR